MSMSDELWLKYKDWIDESLFEGLSDEEEEEKRLELYEKYGPTYILRKDAPKEAIKAVIEEDRLTREADEAGAIL